MSGRATDPAREVERLEIENARLRARLEQQVQSQLDLAQGLGATRQLGAILGTSLAHAIGLSGADSGAVYMIDQGRSCLEIACHRGFTPAYLRARQAIPLDHPMLQPGLAGDTTFLNLPDDGTSQDEHDRAEGLTAAIILPILHGEAVFGGLYLCSHTRESFDPGGLGALTLLARQLGAAIARSRAKADQELLAQVVESSIVGIGITGLDGLASYVNPALAAMWGYPSPAGVVGGSVFDWWADRDAAVAIFARVIAEGSVTDELVARRADGSSFTAVGTASLVKDAEGAPSHVVGSFIDISEIQRGRDAQRQMRLADAINGLLLRTLEGEDDRGLGCACVRVAMDLTGAAMGLLGTIGPDGRLAQSFAVGASVVAAASDGKFAEYFPGAEPLRGLWAYALSQPEPLVCNQPAEHPASTGLPTGHPAVENILFVPLCRDGAPVAILAVANRPGGFCDRQVDAASILGPVILQVLDYRRSERARLRSERRVREQEALLRQAQKLEAIGRLAGGVAHDFNNLLAVVSLFSESLLAGLEPGSELAEDARTIVETAQRGADLTRQLLAFGRRAVLKPVHLQAGALVVEITSMIRRLVGDGIELEVDAKPDAGWIHADPGEMGQVLMNLAVNARDAMPEGGALRISVLDHEVVDGQHHPDLTPGEYVELRVEDTGVGIGPEQLELIFEPFFTTKELGKGTGLGLATVYGIVKQTGGTIRVDSELGKGTTFHIYLPRVHGSERPLTAAVPPPATARGGETILLAEDEPQVRRGAARGLRQAGFQVLEAANAGEALLIAEQHVGPIHVLVSDIDMPRISGPQLARRLQLGRPGIKVLLVTGHGGDHLAEIDSTVEGARLLVKPFAAQQLAGAVRTLLDGGSG